MDGALGCYSNSVISFMTLSHNGCAGIVFMYSTCGVVHCKGGGRGYYRDPSDPWKSFPSKAFESGDIKYVPRCSMYISVPESIRFTNVKLVETASPR